MLFSKIRHHLWSPWYYSRLKYFFLKATSFLKTLEIFGWKIALFSNPTNLILNSERLPRFELEDLHNSTFFNNDFLFIELFNYNS